MQFCISGYVTKKKQAGAELCQAQLKLGLVKLALVFCEPGCDIAIN